MSGDLDNYKRAIVGIYDRAAPIYGTIGPAFFQHAGRRLVEIANLAVGARVLDVATGRGAALFPAAERVGPTGYVLGIDLSSAMVRETAADVARRGLGHVDVRVMDAEDLRVADASFDAVLCSFAIFFFAHLDRVLASFRRALRPGGVVGIGLAEETDSRWDWLGELFDRYAHLEATPTAVLGSRVRQTGVLPELLKSAGFADVREVRDEADFPIRDRAEWWAALWTHGTRRAMEAMTPEDLEHFRTAAFARIDQMMSQAPLGQRFRFTFTVARR